MQLITMFKLKDDQFQALEVGQLLKTSYVKANQLITRQWLPV